MKALSCLIIAVALSITGSAKATGVPLRFAPRVYVAPPVIVQQQPLLLQQAPPLFLDGAYIQGGYSPAFGILRERAFVPFNTFRGFGVGFGFQRGFRFRR